MMENQFEPITYNEETESVYIYFTEPKKFDFYTEQLPENPEIILDLGKEVPVVGIELAGELANKVAQLPAEQRCFVKGTDNYGHDYYSFRFKEKPIMHSISYERIVDVKFLFADDEFLDLIGIEVYNPNSNYIFVQPEEEKAKGMLKKLIGKIRNK